jgi:ribosomal protein S6--L-glutamate ligase
MILSFHPCFDTEVQIILGDRSLESNDHEFIRKADAIILPQGCPKNLYEACSGSDALIFPNYEMRFKYPGKMGQNLLFKNFNCPHPETLCWKSVREFREAYALSEPFPHELPFMIKADKRHEAEGTYFVEDRDSLSAALEYLTHQERSGLWGFITQAHVFSGGNVLRAVIIGKRGITYWKCPGKPGQVITTISRGATIEHHWRPDLQAKGKAQAHAFSKGVGINLAAIDFVFPLSQEDPGPIFLEVNYYFARRGLGGSSGYYRLLYQALRDWLAEAGLDPNSVKLI